ncbi:MAG: STAS/SEC14 domain-containing protein, partial [Bacteroidales bacterium]
MFKILDITKDNLIGFRASGKIEEEDYEKLNPILEKTKKEQEAIRLYIEIGELHGITFKALIKDIVTYF